MRRLSQGWGSKLADGNVSSHANSTVSLLWRFFYDRFECMNCTLHFRILCGGERTLQTQIIKCLSTVVCSVYRVFVKTFDFAIVAVCCCRLPSVPLYTPPYSFWTLFLSRPSSPVLLNLNSKWIIIIIISKKDYVGGEAYSTLLLQSRSVQYIKVHRFYIYHGWWTVQHK